MYSAFRDEINTLKETVEQLQSKIAEITSSVQVVEGAIMHNPKFKATSVHASKYTGRPDLMFEGPIASYYKPSHKHSFKFSNRSWQTMMQREDSQVCLATHHTGTLASHFHTLSGDPGRNRMYLANMGDPNKPAHVRFARINSNEARYDKPRYSEITYKFGQTPRENYLDLDVFSGTPGTTTRAARFRGDGSMVTGEIMAESITESSDRRIKSNIRDLDGEFALEALGKLIPSTYTKEVNCETSHEIIQSANGGYVTTSEFSCTTQPQLSAGLIAQDVLNLAPELEYIVKGEPEERDEAGQRIMMGINYTPLIAYNVAAINHLSANFQALSVQQFNSQQSALDQITDVEGRTTDIEASATDLAVRVTVLEGQLANAIIQQQQDAVALDSNIRIERQRLDQIDSNISILEGRVLSSEGLISSLGVDLDQLEVQQADDVADLEARISSLEGNSVTASVLEGRLSSVEIDVTALESQVMILEVNLEANASAVLDVIANLAVIGANTVSLTQLQLVENTLGDEIQEVEGRVTILEAGRSNSEFELGLLSANVAGAVAAITEVEANLAALQAGSANSEALLTETLGNIATLQQTQLGLISDVANAILEARLEAQNEIALVEDRVADTEMAQQLIQDQIDEIRANVANIRLDLDEDILFSLGDAANLQTALNLISDLQTNVQVNSNSILVVTDTAGVNSDRIDDLQSRVDGADIDISRLDDLANEANTKLANLANQSLSFDERLTAFEALDTSQLEQRVLDVEANIQEVYTAVANAQMFDLSSLSVRVEQAEAVSNTALSLVGAAEANAAAVASAVAEVQLSVFSVASDVDDIDSRLEDVELDVISVKAGQSQIEGSVSALQANDVIFGLELGGQVTLIGDQLEALESVDISLQAQIDSLDPNAILLQIHGLGADISSLESDLSLTNSRVSAVEVNLAQVDPGLITATALQLSRVEANLEVLGDGVINAQADATLALAEAANLAANLELAQSAIDLRFLTTDAAIELNRLDVGDLRQQIVRVEVEVANVAAKAASDALDVQTQVGVLQTLVEAEAELRELADSRLQANIGGIEDVANAIAQEVADFQLSLGARVDEVEGGLVQAEQRDLALEQSLLSEISDVANLALASNVFVLQELVRLEDYLSNVNSFTADIRENQLSTDANVANIANAITDGRTDSASDADTLLDLYTLAAQDLSRSVAFDFVDAPEVARGAVQPATFVHKLLFQEGTSDKATFGIRITAKPWNPSSSVRIDFTPCSFFIPRMVTIHNAEVLSEVSPGVYDIRLSNAYYPNHTDMVLRGAQYTPPVITEL